MMQYDKNGDKKISKEEAPDRMKQFFDRLDPNSDGFIDEAEIKALRERFSGGGGRGGRGGGKKAEAGEKKAEAGEKKAEDGEKKAEDGGQAKGN